MFTTPAASAPTLSTTTSPASPTSPGRSRLRGLSYLRTYTQTHLHARSDSEASNPSSRPLFPRARSQPEDSSTALDRTQQTQTSHPDQTTRRTPSPPSTTSGWLPTVPGRNGTSRAPIRQQSTCSEPPSSEPAPTVTTTVEPTPTPMMTRNRADTAAPALSVRATSGPRTASAENTAPGDVNGQSSMPSIRLIPHYDPRANRPSLSFPAVTRTLPTDTSVIRVGRYSERENAPEIPANIPSSAPVGFKSKVVSRRHCEFWCQNNQWYIKDVKSSSGTFLNHLRLSPPGAESRAYPVNDGDVVQLGIDFRGGEEMIFRCVKIRIECNRGWQKALNNFNKKTHKQLRNLAKPKKDSDTASVNSSECSICLMAIAPCQSLFVAPCSHVWHYKCIRPILNGHTWPNFLCPNCRAVADLEADVEEQEDEWEDDSIEAAIEASKQDKKDGLRNGTKGHDDLDGDEEPDGVRTPRAMEPMHNPREEGQAGAGSSMVASIRNINDDNPMPGAYEEDMTALMDDLSLHPTATATLDPESDPEQHHGPSDQPSSSSLAAPRPIPSRPGSNFELRPTASGVEAGPMTPRNDAGPFVLDGGAGRNGTPGGSRRGVASLDAAAATS